MNAMVGGRVVNDYGFIEPSLWINYAAGNIFNASANILFEKENAFWAGATLTTDLLTSIQLGYILSKDWLKGAQLRIGALGNYSIGTINTQQGAGFEFLLAYRVAL